MRAVSKSTLWVVAAIVTLGIAHPAYADLYLFAFESGDGVSYPGGSSPLQGNLGFDNSTYFTNSMDLASPLIVVASSGVPFTTGLFIGADATDWFFGPGGSFSLNGEVIGTPPTNVLIPSTTLLTGSFLGTTTDRKSVV